MKRRSRVSDVISLQDAREGTAAIEFALSASVLVPLFVGAASLGLASWTKMQVDNAARAGAVYAVNHVSDTGGITTAAKNATALSDLIVMPPVKATQSCTDPASGIISSANGATACPSTGSPPGDYVTVTTQYSYPFILPVPGIADVVTLKGKAVARIK